MRRRARVRLLQLGLQGVGERLAVLPELADALVELRWEGRREGRQEERGQLRPRRRARKKNRVLERTCEGWGRWVTSREREEGEGGRGRGRESKVRVSHEGGDEGEGRQGSRRVTNLRREGRGESKVSIRREDGATSREARDVPSRRPSGPREATSGTWARRRRTRPWRWARPSWRSPRRGAGGRPRCCSSAPQGASGQ